MSFSGHGHEDNAHARARAMAPEQHGGVAREVLQCNAGRGRPGGKGEIIALNDATEDETTSRRGGLERYTNWKLGVGCNRTQHGELFATKAKLRPRRTHWRVLEWPLGRGHISRAIRRREASQLHRVRPTGIEAHRTQRYWQDDWAGAGSRAELALTHRRK